MTLKIWKVDGRYRATLVQGDKRWDTPRSMTEDELTQELEGRGCHPRDVWEAFDEAEGKFPPPPFGARK